MSRFSPAAAFGGRRVLLPYLASLAVVSVFAMIAVFFFGQVRGVEFAPSHFELRGFTYWEVPVLKLQITPIQRTPMGQPLTNLLTTGGQTFLAPGGAPPADWDLVEVTRGSRTEVADAKLLADFLLARQAYRPVGLFQGHLSTTDYWTPWTSANPQHAAALWPRVQTLAKRQQYLLVPDLFRLAQRATQPDFAVSAAELTKQIDQFLADRYATLIDDFQTAGLIDSAESLQQDAQQDFPDDPRFRRPRSD